MKALSARLKLSSPTELVLLNFSFDPPPPPIFPRQTCEHKRRYTFIDKSQDTACAQPTFFIYHRGNRVFFLRVRVFAGACEIARRIPRCIAKQAETRRGRRTRKILLISQLRRVCTSSQTAVSCPPTWTTLNSNSPVARGKISIAPSGVENNRRSRNTVTARINRWPGGKHRSTGAQVYQL